MRGPAISRSGSRRLLDAKREVSDDVDAAARAIIADVRARGDDALVAFTQRFDRVNVAGRLAISPDDVARAREKADPAVVAALGFAHARITAFHERQRPADLSFTDPLGVELGWRWSAVESVGLYVPGGTARQSPLRS